MDAEDIMDVIEITEADPKQWYLSGKKIEEGSILQVQRGSEWVTVRVNYHYLLRELRFYYLEEATAESLPIIEGTPARWVNSHES